MRASAAKAGWARIAMVSNVIPATAARIASSGESRRRLAGAFASESSGFQRRIVARKDRVGQKLGRIHRPELAVLVVDLHRLVRHPALDLLRAADIDVNDSVA